MISLWVGVTALVAIALLPLVLSLQRAAGARSRREAALALHRAQLVELGRELEEGRLAPAEHATAVLEVQRRMLAAAELSDPTAQSTSGSALWAAVALVPIGGLLLYLVGGSPGLPAMPLKERMAAAEQRVRQEDALVAQLRQVLRGLDPHSDKAREGYILLGNAEARLGHMHGAAAAWQTALEVRFDATLAVETAEAITEANGRVTDDATALFRRALAEAPATAPWRPMAERRLGGG
ncbi:MAG TPA: c-type cytochrome biogenesis protein CcmI [Acetobacteraceae bacterium]|nr:c-type cytochrome biogenesis protein CcmI [Acetobacteraceae bacterium]